jgi:hypothetical protein
MDGALMNLSGRRRRISANFARRFFALTGRRFRLADLRRCIARGSRFSRDSGGARCRIFRGRHGAFSCRWPARKILLDAAGIQIESLPDLDARGRSPAGNPY